MSTCQHADTYYQTHQTQGIYGDTQSHRHRHTLTLKTFRSHSAVWHAKAAFFRSADVLVGAVGAALGWPLGRSSVMKTTYKYVQYHCQNVCYLMLLDATCTYLYCSLLHHVFLDAEGVCGDSTTKCTCIICKPFLSFCHPEFEFLHSLRMLLMLPGSQVLEWCPSWRQAIHSNSTVSGFLLYIRLRAEGGLSLS